MQKLINEITAYFRWVDGPTAPAWVFVVTAIVCLALGGTAIGVAVVTLVERPKTFLVVLFVVLVVAARAAWQEYRRHKP